MLSFWKNWLKRSAAEEEAEPVKEESILPAEAAAPSQETEAAPAREENGYATPLSLHETWEAALDAQQKYALSFMASELPPIPAGHVSLAGIRMFPHDDGVEVTAFVRNGLNRPVRLEDVNLVLLFDDNRLFARQTFSLAEMGEIPPLSARPWSFVFRRENFLVRDVLLKNWKLAFEMAEKRLVLPQQLELEESWIKSLSDGQKNALIRLARELPPLQPGEVNIQSVQISRGSDESLRALLLIRNGSGRSLSLERLPLVLLDAKGEKAAEGLFELGGLTVNAGTSKPWLFIFPRESVINPGADLSRWKVTVPAGA